MGLQIIHNRLLMRDLFDLFDRYIDRRFEIPDRVIKPRYDSLARSFTVYHPVHPSSRGEYEVTEAIDLLIRSAQTIDAIRRDGWRLDIGCPKNRDKAKRRPYGK